MLEPFIIMTILCIGACFILILKQSGQIEKLEERIGQLEENKSKESAQK